MKVTFKREREKWYPDSYAVKLDGIEIGSIAQPQDDDRWGWSLRCDEKGIPWKNTWHEKQPGVTLEEAKAQVKAYVRGCLSSVEGG